VSFDVVIATAGRPSLAALLHGLATSAGPVPGRVVVVDDRRVPAAPLPVGAAVAAGLAVAVVRGPARGPAAARNAGWRATRAAWVAFLDDDVEPEPGWAAALAADLDGLEADVAGSQGRIAVPAPAGRRPTDWERNVAGLQTARWATADMAYRRPALEAAGGFDERFTRAYREDADLALRLLAGGWRLTSGARTVRHPVGAAPPGVSLRKQAGNADDVLMRRLHGAGWRERAGAPPGRRRRHLAVTAAGAAALAPRLPRVLRTSAAAGWLAGTAELAWARIAPGPRTPREVGRMGWTSVLLPPVAAAHVARGLARHRGVGPAAPAAPAPPAAVLFDRDGTLVRDVPYNGDPARVELMPGARQAVKRLRARDVRLGVVSNQSGVGRGLISGDDVAAVNARVEELLGTFDTWAVCPHAPGDGCECRKPRPGLVRRAARDLGLEPERCAVIGDIGADMAAAAAAGARAVMVPTPVTRPQEVADAPRVAPTVAHAVAGLLGETPPAAAGTDGAGAGATPPVRMVA
jgi:histidinol-phosphate phosphatase family protein